MWKRAKRIGLVLLAAGFGLGAAALIVIQTSGFQQWLLRRLENVAGAAGYRLTAKRLNLNMWKLQASLEGVVYDDGKGTRVTVDRFFVDIPRNAFRGNLDEITNLEADGVSIGIRSAGPSEPSGKRVQALRIVFRRLAIRNGSLTYSDPSTTVRIPSFDLEAQDGRGALRLGSPISISPDVRFAILELPLQISDESLDFGPSPFRIEHPEVTVMGSSHGHLQWSPSLAVNFDYTTDPFSYRNWRDLESSANIRYENGTLRVMNFRAGSGAGNVTGAAEVQGESKSADLVWRAVNLAPAGFPAFADGNIQLQWKASDFSDVSGKGSLLINSRQYGRAQSDMTIENSRAKLNLAAKAFDATVRANITTGFDQTLSGTFQAAYNKYGTVRLEGSLSGTFQDPRANARVIASGMTYSGIGPLDASANASLKSRILSIDDIQAQFKNSHVPRGFLRLDLDSTQIAGEIPDIQVQLGDFAPQAAGSVTFSALVEGSVNRPAARISGSSDGLDIAGTRIDSAGLTGRITTDEFAVTELTARQREGVLNASGSYKFKTDEIAGDAGITNLQINPIPDVSTTLSLTTSFQGTLRSPAAHFNGGLRNLIYRNQEQGDLDLDGTIQDGLASVLLQSDKYRAMGTAEVGLKEPYAFTGSLTANQSRIHYEEYDVTANGKVQAAGELKPFKAEHIRFDDFRIRGEGVDLLASGSFPDGAKVTATADLAQLPVDSAQLSGDARVEAIVSGTLEDPRIEGGVESTNATIRTSGMTEPARIQAAVDFTRNEFTIRQARASFRSATADITGQGTLNGAGHFQFRAADIKPEEMLKDRPMAGVIGVEGEIDLAAPNLEAISGSVKVTELQLSVRDVAIHQVQPIELRIANQVLEARNFVIEGFDTRAAITGNANLRTRALNFDIDGTTDLKLLDAFLPGSNPGGQIQTSIAVRGTSDQPDLDGVVNLRRMQLQISEPPVSIADVNAEIQLQRDRIQIAGASGTVNGGTFTASGGAGFSTAALGNTAIQFSVAGAQTEYPEGFQSEISSRLSLNGSGSNLEISGNVELLSGVYRRDIDLAQEVFSRIAADSARALTGRASQPSAVDQIRLNITAGTTGVVSVTNNLANFDMEGSFLLRGTIGNPIITGRARVAEGGEIYFGPQVGASSSTGLERRDKYVIAEGSIDFNNPIRTEPSFTFVATRELQTTSDRYIITLRASGTPDKPKTELTSDPSLPEPDIVALLLTGRTFDKLQGSELNVAREQVASYLSGRFGNTFQKAGSAFGLNTVRIDPVLLAGDEDLSAKLTLGKDITQNFNMVYSQNLSGPRAQTWIASYAAIKDLLIRGINRSDENNLTLELRHDLKWGGGPTLPKAARPKDEKTFGKVTFEGTTIPMKDLLKQITKTGKPFNAYRMNEDVRNLQKFFAGRDFLKVKIRAERSPRDREAQARQGAASRDEAQARKGAASRDLVDVRFVIDEGPSITFAFEGAKTPKHIREEIRQIWIRGFAEASSLRQSQLRLLRYFHDDGYLQAAVSARDGSSNPANRRFVFDISQGPRFQTPEWVFKGIQPLDLNVTPGTLLENPKAIQDRIQSDLWKDGYLNASCTEPELRINGRQARFEIAVERGPRYSIGKITTNDSEAIRDLPPGEGGQKPGEGVFTSAWLDRARQSIISKYWEKGFNDVQVTAATHIPDRGTVVDIDLKIDPGEQQVIHEIQIEGHKTTDLQYVRRQFTFKEGDPVDYSRVDLTRKKLYDTRLFKRVDLNVVKDESGYIAKTSLNEKPPWNFRYGFAVTDQLQTSDREFGATADFSYSNLLGRAITAGTSLKYSADTREARIFGSLPVFFGKSATTTASVFRTRNLTQPDVTQPDLNLITHLWGFTIQQQWQLRNRYLLSYDYSYKRTHTSDPKDPFAFGVTIPIARFNGTLTRDTRDDILNATKGSFLSNSFEIAPPGVGSSIQFLRNFTQYFRFQAVSGHLVWASALRVGAAKGFHGQDLIPTERFRAGGGTTLRGFQQDQLATPGNGLLVVNQELRFPLFWRFSGVSFLDAGNVYPSIGDFNPLRLRYSPGVGIRIQTPFVLVRFDMGFNVFPRAGEPRRRFAFGVGQAF